MNTYAALRVKYAFGEPITGVPGNSALIDKYPWGGAYRPQAGARVEWDETALRVALWAREETIISRETRFCGRVCEDSCLEFFVNPCPARGNKYVNFEINPTGVMFIGVGTGREDRRALDAQPEDMRISTYRGAGLWTASYRVPFALLESLCGGVEREMRANFYKCDESIHPHFGVWNAVVADSPDFHLPECFGRIILAQAD